MPKLIFQAPCHLNQRSEFYSIFFDMGEVDCSKGHTSFNATSMNGLLKCLMNDRDLNPDRLLSV